MLIPVAFINTLNLNLLFLAICCILLYSGFSIHNAIQDNDYILPKYAKLVFIGMVLLSILLSFYNKIIFFTVVAWIVLGYIYNTVSRKYLFADISVLCATNFGIPILSSGLLLGLDISFALLLSGFMYIIYWFILNIKNMVGWEEDKLRGYKTIGTKYDNTSGLLKIFYISSFVLIVLSSFIFNMHNSYFFCGIIFLVLTYFVFICIDMKEWKLGLRTTRTIMLFITVSFLIGKSVDFAFPAFLFFLIHCFSWLPDLALLIKDNAFEKDTIEGLEN
jgi:4-hydroxybenzoate polyprenyltransferase